MLNDTSCLFCDFRYHIIHRQVETLYDLSIDLLLEDEHMCSGSSIVSVNVPVSAN